MNFSLSNTDRPPLEEPHVWTVEGRDWLDSEERWSPDSLGISPGQSIYKFLCTFSPFGKRHIIFHYVMNEEFLSESGEVLTKLCKRCPWDSLICHPGYSLPAISICNFWGLVSDVHTEWPPISLPEGETAEVVASILLRWLSIFMVLRN